MTRTAKEFQRIYGSLDRASHIRDRFCIACGRTPCHNAHTVSGGTGRKADYTTIVPLCHHCHHRLHQIGVTSWQAEAQLNLADEAADTQRRWVQHNDGNDPCATP